MDKTMSQITTTLVATYRAILLYIPATLDWVNHLLDTIHHLQGIIPLQVNIPLQASIHHRLLGILLEHTLHRQDLQGIIQQRQDLQGIIHHRQDIILLLEATQ